MDPYEVAASAQAQRASASASAQASRDAALGPDLVAKRDAALATQAPQKPAELSEDTPGGARAAALYFIDLYQYAFVTGDTDELETLSEKRCAFCNDLIDDVSSLHEKGGWADPWTQTIEDVTVFELNPGYDYRRVDVTVSSGESMSYTGDGTATLNTAAQNEVLCLALRYSDGQWTVGGVELVQS